MNRKALREILMSEGLVAGPKRYAPIRVKPEDLPANRLGPDVNVMFQRRTRFDNPDADVAKGRSRREKFKKQWVDRE